MSSKLVTLGGEQIELRPLTTGEFLELLYMASDVIHEALTAWAVKQEAYSFVASVMSNLPKEDALRVMYLFLRTTPEWLEENYVSADEAYEALREAVKLNDWSEMLQTMMVLDTIRAEEIMQVLSLREV